MDEEINTAAELETALAKAGFKRKEGPREQITYKKDGVLVKKEFSWENTSQVVKPHWRVYARTQRGGYKKLHHADTLDCVYKCATTCEPKTVVEPHEIKPIPFVGNTTIYRHRDDDDPTNCVYAVYHQVKFVRVQLATLNKDGSISLKPEDLAGPGTEIWWLCRCINYKGAKFYILTDEKVLYPAVPTESRGNKNTVPNWRIVNDFRIKGIKLDELTKTDVYMISFVIDEYKRTVHGGNNETKEKG